MEHADALERIEIAAAEPDGLERLMAGDTPDAAAVAGHLAGCPACTAELAQIRRTASIARSVIRAQPDPALRERTLAYVRAVGRDRSGGVAVAEAPIEAVATVPAAATAGTSGPTGVHVRERLAAPDVVSPTPLPPAPIPLARARGRAAGLRLPWGAGLAAAAVVAVAVGLAAGSLLQVDRVASREAQIEVLERSAQANVRIERQADAVHVGLESTPAGGGAAGSLVFSPSTGEIVVTADGLTFPPDGKEYGCWVEVDGVRTRLGRMYWGGEVATWAGPAHGLANLPAGAAFGVSLGPVGGGAGSETVLVGHT